MSTKLPLEVLSASWVATSSNGVGNNLTNTIYLEPYSCYLVVAHMPNTTYSSGTYFPVRLSSDYSKTQRHVHKTRGTTAWHITTSSGITELKLQANTSTTTTYSDIGYAGLYAIKLREGIYHDVNRTGVLLPLDVQIQTWTASSTAAANAQLTNSVTLQKGHTYLILVNSPYCSFGTAPQPIALYNNVSEWGYKNITSYGSTIWVGTARADMTTYALTGYSASRTYSNTSYGGIYAIKIA